MLVPVILILAAIVFPIFPRSRMRANEPSAGVFTRVITPAAVTYSITYPTAGYPPQLITLGGANPCTSSSTQSCLIDDVLAQGTKSGYNFAWTGDGATPSVTYIVTGTPQPARPPAHRRFSPHH